MNKLEKELDALIKSAEYGGFGDHDALKAFERQVDLIKFKINQRNKIASNILSAVIGAIIATIITMVLGLVGIK